MMDMKNIAVVSNRIVIYNSHRDLEKMKKQVGNAKRVARSHFNLQTLDKVLDDAAMLEIFLSSPPLNTFGRPSKVMRAFGGKEHFHQAMRELQDIIYQD